MVKKCKCTADSRGNTSGALYQDEKYGAGQRVHTVGGPSSVDRKLKCTVCADLKYSRKAQYKHIDG